VLGPDTWPMTSKQNDKATVERVERMILWLRANTARICSVERVQVTFNCAGPAIKTEIREGGKA